jgi:hypothetical protein
VKIGTTISIMNMSYVLIVFKYDTVESQR